jgi:hypothetical protein
VGKKGANGGDDMKSAGGGIQSSVKSMAFNQISNALTDTVSMWSTAQDRSAIMSQIGSDNLLGAHISELQRTTNIKGGISQGGGVALGAIIGSIFPGIGSFRRSSRYRNRNYR